MLTSFKKPYLTLTFVYFIVSNLFLHAGWEEVTLPARQSTAEVTGLYFIDDNTGFISVNDDNGLYKTTDAGTTWTTYSATDLDLPEGKTPVTKASFDFISEQVGFMLCETNGYGLYVYKTTNGGVSWDSLYDVGGGHGDIDFYNEQFGVVSNHSYVHVTGDGGQTWKRVSVGSILVLNTNMKVNIVGIDTISVQFNRGGYFSTDNGNTFTEVSSLGFNPLMVSFLGKTGYASISSNLYRSPDGGFSWNLVNTNTEYLKNRSVFTWSVDTILAGKDRDIVRSVDGGNTWYTQPSASINGTGFQYDYELFSRGQNTLYAVNGEAYRLFSSSDAGGCVTPDIQTTPTEYICSGDSIDIISPNDPAYQYYWKYKDEIISLEKDLHWRIPEIYRTGYDYLYIYGTTTGECVDSVAQSVYFYASPNPPEFTATLESFTNCDNNNKIVSIHPYYPDYSFKYSPDTTSVYYNFTYSGSSNDTGFFQADIDFDLNYTIQASINNMCGSGTRETTLIKNESPYEFNLDLVSFDKDIYCLYDTVRIILARSEPGAKYWINGTIHSGQISNPDTLLGNGEELIFSVPRSKIITSNLSIYILTKRGCAGDLNIPPYSYENRTSFYTMPVKSVFRKSDTVVINRYKHSTDSLCMWYIGNYQNETSFPDHDAFKEAFGIPGEYYAYNTVLSKNLCLYTSDTSFVIVAESNELINENPICEKDTNIMRYQYLDMHRDKAGNFYTAGYAVTNDLAGSPNAVPMMYFAKYNADRELIWEFNSETRTSYSWTFFNYAYGLSITTDDSSNVYLTGLTSSHIYFSFDSLTYDNLSGNDECLSFVAKMDSSANLKWLRLFKPNYSTLGAIFNGFTDIEVVDGRIFVTSDMRQIGKIYKPVTSTSWEVVLDDFYGDKLFEFDPDGSVVSYEDISNSYSDRGIQWKVYGGVTSMMYSQNVKMSVDKQNRLNIYLNRRFSSPVATVGNIGFSNLIDRYIEVNAVYDINYGFLSATVLNSYNVPEREHNRFRHMVSDSYGNKYFVAHSGSMPIYNYPGDIMAGTLNNESGSWLMKYDDNNNLLWKKRIFNTHISDIYLSEDETVLFLVLFPPVDNFTYYDYITAFENNNQVVYYDKDDAKPTLLRINTDGEVMDYSDLDVDVNISSNTYFSLNYLTADTNNVVNYLSRDHLIKITNENKVCDEKSYNHEIRDTLVLKYRIDSIRCDSINYLLTWISTPNIENVNIGYYADNDGEKHFTSVNHPADSYALRINSYDIVSADSIAFFIESVDGIFAEVSPFIRLQKHIDLGKDTVITDAVSLVLDAGIGFDEYLWNDGTTNQLLEVFDDGNYSVIVTDSISCSYTDSIKVTFIETVTPLVIISQKVTEIENCNKLGSISIHASGGVGTLSYSIDNGQTFYKNDGLFQDLSSGKYYVVVRDSLDNRVQGKTLVVHSFFKIFNIGEILEFQTDNYLKRSYSCFAADHWEYHWRIVNGTIMGDPQHRTIDVTWNDNDSSKVLSLYVVDDGGCVSNTVNFVPVLIKPVVMGTKGDLKSMDVHIFPNPASDIMHVDIQNISFYGIVSVRIYDFSGKILLNANKTGGKFEIDVSQFVQGNYVLHIENNGKVYRSTFQVR